MKKILVLSLAVLVVATLLSTSVIASEARGPAPNSGDGIPDGPGWAGDWVNDDKPGEIKGPAPNSGDGIPDGPGWAGDWVNDDKPGETTGPAPNSGDGIPDGSGF